ncbi:MAG: hypothetical protein IK104_05845 [Clostridia bacterium]|nr:hypothetical protein [Clostridia bacterium]
MLSALLQTIANLGFDAQAVNAAFQSAMDSIENGDTSSLQGLVGIFKGVIAAVTGADAADIGLVLNSLATSVIDLLSNPNSSAVLSTITGA